MKRALLIFQFLFIFSQNYLNIYSQDLNKEYIISPRIGSEIDKNEKEYFNLFPVINNFKSAKTYIDSKDSIIFVIQYDSLGIEKSQKMGMNKVTADNLKFAIENYEKFYSNDFVNSSASKSFKAVPHKYIDIIMRYDSEKNQVITLKTTDNNTITEKLLYSDSCYIVVCPSDYYYDWQTAEKNIKIFHVLEIKKIDNTNVDINTGNIDFFNNLNDLQEVQSFANFKGRNEYIIAPEIYKLMRKKDIEYSNFKYSASIAQAQTLTNNKEMILKKFNLSIGVTPLSFMNNSLSYKFRFYGLKYNSKDNTYSVGNYDLTSSNINQDFIPEINLEYFILPRFSVGLSYSYNKVEVNNQIIMFPYQIPDYDTILNTTMKLKSNIFRACFSYTIIPYIPHKLAKYQDIALTISFGVIAQSLQFEYSNNFLNQKENNIPNSFNDFFIGLLISPKLDYYLNNLLSAYAKININIFGSKDSEVFTYNYKESKFHHNCLFELTNNSISLSNLTLFLGLSFHF